MFDSILLVYYHPIVFDLAQTFKQHGLFKNVEIAVSGPLKDNYGDQNRVLAECKARGFVGLPLPAALINIKNKKYSIVGLDGVFQQDNLVIDTCQNLKIPFFCINGYPHNIDEPSQNILSFSWFLPQMQYKMMYGHEGAIKDVDWRNIAEKGFGGPNKNICVFYPEMNDVKKFLSNNVLDIGLMHKSFDFPTKKSGAVSFIYRFEECNKWSHEVYKRIGLIKNYDNLDSNEVHKLLWKTKWLAHLKHGDCPGVSVLEAMLLGCVPIVMQSFVLASFNQDLLIDRYSAVVCKTTDEFSQVLSLGNIPHLDFMFNQDLYYTTHNHAMTMTNFNRQQNKLVYFFERCLNGKY
jgi:hypothetical protein